jgi:SPP1 gp7 family putative phage head morphogenesis protein
MYNFGNIPAEFKFQPVEDSKKLELLTLWLSAVNTSKIPITDNHINWFLDNIDAPEISEKELIEINEQKEKMREQLSRNENQADNDEESQEKEKNDKPLQKEDKKDNNLKHIYVESRNRELTQYEKKIDFTKIENDFETIEKKYIEELALAYQLSINSLADEIKRKQIVEKKKFQLINKLDLKHNLKIKKILKLLMKESLSIGLESIEKQYIIEDSNVLNDDDLADWIEQHAEYITTTESNFILEKVKVSLSEGIRSGDSVRDIMSSISDVLSGYNIVEEANKLERIVRTNINAAYNEGRAQAYNEMSELIQGYQYSAILDGRTSDICAALDKKIFKPTELSYYNPPNHFNCRSLIVPIFKDEELIKNPAPATERDKVSGGNFLRLK